MRCSPATATLTPQRTRRVAGERCHSLSQLLPFLDEYRSVLEGQPGVDVRVLIIDDDRLTSALS